MSDDRRPDDLEHEDDGWNSPGWKNAAHEYHANREREAHRAGNDNKGLGDEYELVSVKASSIKMTIIRWMWPERFAVGKIGIIAGLPDEGKGQTLAFIAAQVTNGGKWPMKEGCAPQGNVIIFSDEDDPNDTLVPRLAAAGADLDRVHIIKLVRNDKNGTRMFSLVSDIEVLRRKIIEIGGVVLVLIDPISAYLGVGKVDSFRSTDVRGAHAADIDGGRHQGRDYRRDALQQKNRCGQRVVAHLG